MTDEPTGYCFSHHRLLFEEAPREHYEDGCHVGYAGLLSHPRAPVPTPPLPPHPDHAPEQPDLPVAETNVDVVCPRCGAHTFGRRYEDGSLWSGGHYHHRNVGWCRPQPVLQQARLEVAA